MALTYRLKAIVIGEVHMVDCALSSCICRLEEIVIGEVHMVDVLSHLAFFVWKKL